MNKIYFPISVILLFTFSVHAQDPLPSWNESPIKKRITDFVTAVTTSNNPQYVPPNERIATFDNDGTLWCEKPVPIHGVALSDRFKELVKADPSLINRQPYKAVVNQDKEYFKDLFEDHSYETIVGQLMAVPFGGMTLSAYDKWNQHWLDTWKHPRFKVGYKDLVYQPMVELVHYLQNNDFDVYIFTADEAAFVRLISYEIYSIPKQNVQGTTVVLEWNSNQENVEMLRTYQAGYFDNWDKKAKLIQQVVGKRPLFAAGNSNGDQQMLEYSTGLSLLVHHTDGEREFKYDTHTEIVIPMAQKKGWLIVDMKNDWKAVFPNIKN